MITSQLKRKILIRILSSHLLWFIGGWIIWHYGSWQLLLGIVLVSWANNIESEDVSYTEKDLMKDLTKGNTL